MRYGFVIDQGRCIGCHACTVACKEEHQVPVGVFRTWVKHIEKGEFPHSSRHFGVMRCNHCDDSPCTEICPTSALYRRSDGIVDFDNRRCIGCKPCIQACPYDALYIDPNNNTAAKCNFCAHRVEMRLEPACVIVCPTQAILAGDLDHPGSKVSRIGASKKVWVPKPQKGTQPKLFYVGNEGDLLEPTRISRKDTYFASDRPDGNSQVDANDGSNLAGALAREVYDVPHPAPWGWKIAAYLWTKAIAAGVLLVAAILLSFAGASAGPLFNIVCPAIALAGLRRVLLDWLRRARDRVVAVRYFRQLSAERVAMVCCCVCHCERVLLRISFRPGERPRLMAKSAFLVAFVGAGFSRWLGHDINRRHHCGRRFGSSEACRSGTA